MNDDDQLLQFLDEEEYVIKTESYSTVVNSFQNPSSLSKNNQTNSDSLKRLLAHLPSGVSISKPDRRLNNLVTATAKPARGEAGTQTLLQTGQPRVEQKVEKKHKSCSSNTSHFIFQNTKSNKKACCDRCKKKGLKVCEKHSPNAVPATKKKTIPEQPEVSKKCPEKEANQKTLNKNTCLCSDDKSSQIHKSLLIMSSGRCNHCNKASKDASITSMCIDNLFNQAKAYLQKLAEEHKNKCPRCSQRRSCQNLTTTTSNDSVACKESLFEQARDYLNKLTSEHKSTCERCKKKEEQKQVCPALKEPTSKPSYVESILQQAWSYIQNLRAGKRFCCLTNKDCCPRCMKIGLPSCCKHSSEPNSNQGICQPCKPPVKPPECLKKKVDCPSCKKKTKSVCLIDCPSETSHKNICQHCKQSLGEESKNSCCARCKKDGMPVCCKHQDVSKCSSSDTTCSSKSINSLFESLKKQAKETGNKSCPKLCKKKSSDECFSPVLRCKSAEETGQCSYDPCEPSPCCKKKPQKKSSCTGLCSKSSESLDDPRNKPCIGPCTKKCPLKRSGCEFLEYHSSTRCSGPCQSNSMPKKMTGIKLTITPKMSDAEFCKHSCDAVKKVFCPDFSTEPEEPQEQQEPQDDPCTGPCCQPEAPQEWTNEDNQEPEQAEEEEPEQSEAPCGGGCFNCNSQYSSTKVNYEEHRMVDAEYEAFLDDQYGRMVAKELADKETICDKSCDCITCLTNLKLKSAHSEDLNKYRFYY